MVHDVVGRGSTGENNEVSTEQDPRRASPCFLFSYARPAKRTRVSSSPKAQEFVEMFYGDVCDLVSELLPTMPGEDAGYLDVSMEGGQNWTAELGRAVGNCQVFVPLVSPRYVSSEWCARERRAFAARSVEPRRPGVSVAGTAILPVRWASLSSQQREPSQLGHVQRFSPQSSGRPAVAGAYEERGIYGLLATRRRPIYEEVTWQLANRIVAIASDYWVHPGTPEFLNSVQER
jgi:hypothetical protein